MAVCPRCKTTTEELLAPCPGCDGYFYVDEGEFASHSDDRLLGRQIAQRFIISAVLGQGAMGKVYKARQDKVDRDVALKVFRAEKLAERRLGRMGTMVEVDAARARFVQEARVLGKLSHPNCVTIYDFGSALEDSVLYMAMEFVAGVSLRKAIGRGLKFDAIAQIIHQVLQAMREAHALGIVHRDLKPENIVLSYRFSTDEYIVKVLDFGIAKLLQADESALTRAGMLFGTPAYMSPEQCRGEVEGVGPPVDIYALGCMLYEMVCGQLPYPAQFPQQMVRLHQEAPIPALVARRGLDVPAGLEAFIQKCLAKDPTDRFADAREALAAFDELMTAYLRQSAEIELGEGLPLELFALGFAGSARAGAARRPRSVVVPDDHISGHKLDPVGAGGAANHSAAEDGSTPQPEVAATSQSEVASTPQEISVAPEAPASAARSATEDVGGASNGADEHREASRRTHDTLSGDEIGWIEGVSRQKWLVVVAAVAVICCAALAVLFLRVWVF